MTMMTSEFLHSLKVAVTAAEPIALHQRGDRRGVAQPRAVIDVVGAEPGAHQFLKQIGLFVGRLGRTEAGERLRTVLVANSLEAFRGAVERFLPSRLAKMRPRIGRVDDVVRALGHAHPCG